MREVPWVFPTLLVVHALGMGFLAGIGVAFSLRTLGVAVRVPLSWFAEARSIFCLALFANVVSGLGLLAAYPAKALTNPVFFLKVALLIAALWSLQALAYYARQSVPSEFAQSMRRHAIASLCLWAGVITAGRLLAYTHSVLLASWMVGT